MAALKKSSKGADASFSLAQAMPSSGGIKAEHPSDALSRWWDSDLSEWAAALELLAPKLSQEQLDKALREMGMSASSRYGNISSRLAMAQALIDKGASPFAKSAAEDDRYNGHDETFFATLVKGGFWAHARLIAAVPGNKEACRAAIADAATLRRAWSALSKASDGGYAMLADAGAEGFRLGFMAGMGPNDIAGKNPWFFSCSTAEALAQCIGAGADLSLKGAQDSAVAGKTFEESLCLGLAGGALIGNDVRAQMLALLRKQGPAALDAEAGGRALAGLVKVGSRWQQVKEVQDAYGISAVELEDSDGATMLELAIGTGNWMLASNLMRAGADPGAASKRSGLPIIAQALWVEPMGLHRDGKLSEGKVAARKREEATQEVLAALDFEWRDSAGLRLLEAAHAKAAIGLAGGEPKGMISWTAANSMIGRAAIDNKAPLWRRLLDANGRLTSVEAAAKRRSEPWMCPDGEGLLSTLLTARAIELSKSSRTTGFGCDNMEEFVSVLRVADDSEWAAKRSIELFAPAQWKSAWPKWSETLLSSREAEREALVHAMREGVHGWIELARKSGVEPQDMFDFKLMGRLISGGWGEQEASALRELRMHIAEKICLACPGQGGWILLDILAVQSWSSMDSAMKIWLKVEAHGELLAIPSEHRLFQESGAVGEKLCNHMFWRSLEERVVSEAAAPKPALRM